MLQGHAQQSQQAGRSSRDQNIYIFGDITAAQQKASRREAQPSEPASRNGADIKIRKHRPDPGAGRRDYADLQAFQNKKYAEKYQRGSGRPQSVRFKIH